MTINTTLQNYTRNKLVYGILGIALVYHLFLSAFFPISNMEAYYWDWSRNLQLGYYDHPGAVAWFCRMGTELFGNNSFGARFVLCFLNVFASLFLVKTVDVIQLYRGEKTELKQIFFLLFLTNILPVFFIQTFLIMPDAPLYLALSGSLYFSFNFFYKENKLKIFSAKDALLFGAFAGFGLVSKFHIIPIFMTLVLCNIIISPSSFFNKFKFLFLTAVSFVLVASPTLIWNYQHNWVSFGFQAKHGFNEFDFSFFDFYIYFVEGLLYYTPWFYILSFVVLIRYFIKYKIIGNYTFFFSLPFLGIFLIFLASSLSKYIHPYWTAAGFWMITPLIASHIELKNVKLYKFWVYLSAILTFVGPLVLCLPITRETMTNLSKGRVGYQMFYWHDMKKQIEDKIKSHELPNVMSYDEFKKHGCSANQTILASFDWTWVGQLAYHLDNHPATFNFNTRQTSNYTYRDKLSDLKGCSVLFIASAGDLNEDLNKVMTIDKKVDFTPARFQWLPAILILGHVK